MRTDHLITALVADEGGRDRSPREALALAAGLGTLAAAVVFFATLGVRPDCLAALGSPRFVGKFLLTLSLAGAAGAALTQIVRPQARLGTLAAWLAVPLALLLLAVGLELMNVPRADWGRRLVGTNSMLCLVNIPILSAGTLVGTLMALRRGAPRDPATAGALAGLFAAAVGATFYAAHCPDDSPLFVATWYVLATILVTACGAVIGRRVLAW